LAHEYGRCEVKRYGAVMMLRLRESTLKKLRVMAVEDDRPVASLVRRLLDESVDGRGGERRRG
jgi:hypothetical protein